MATRRNTRLILAYITVAVATATLVVAGVMIRNAAAERERSAEATPPADAPAEGTPSADGPAEGTEVRAPGLWPEKPTEPDRTGSPVPEVSLPRVAFIIDDVGYRESDLDRFLTLSVPLTLAVLPGLAESERSARKIAASDKSLFLHQPMEPLGDENPGPGVVTVEMSDADIRATLRANLADVPGAVGANNHMGSRATGDPRVMRVVLSELARQGVAFVDSLTSPDSVVLDVAAELGLPVLVRDVFLDNVDDPAAIDEQLSRVAALFERADGDDPPIVAIGHVTSRYLPDALERFYRDHQARVDFVAVDLRGGLPASARIDGVRRDEVGSDTVGSNAVGPDASKNEGAR